MSTEPERFELHRELKNRLGDHVADSLMTMLPPDGWSDFARTSDIDRLRAEMIARFDQADARTNERLMHLERRMDEKFAHFEARMDQKFEHFDTQMNDRLTHFEARMNDKFADFQARMDQRMDQRFDLLQTGITAQFALLSAQLEERFVRVDERFARHEDRFDDIDRRLKGITAALWTMGTFMGASFIALFTLLASQ